jgi:DNA ligase-1
MKIVNMQDVRDWYLNAADLAEFSRSIGRLDREAQLLRPIDLPLHLQFVIQAKAEEKEGAVPAEAFTSISFFSLCKGLFLPLSALAPERVAHLFGFVAPPMTDDRETLVKKFLAKDIGLTLLEKIGCLLGDPFQGKRSTFRRDSLIRLLRSMRMQARGDMLDRLTKIGDVAVLFAENFDDIKSDPPLTALEVLETLRLLPTASNTQRFGILRSVFERCGKLEAYFLVKLLLRNAGFGFDYQGPLLVKVLAEQFKLSPEQIEHAMALTDPLKVAQVLTDEGAEGLRKIQLRPLSPVRPALAGGLVEDIKKYPVWVERKYDGIRLLLHKDTDAHGSILCGAYTRNRNDWLEMVPGLLHTIQMLPAKGVIVDGELYGTVMSMEGARPASVYEVYCMLQGEPVRPVNLKYAAFDILFLNGQDLTRLPLSHRRQYLMALLTPLAGMALPVPIAVAEGQMVEDREGLNRLFNHFRAQGYEGIIAKDWNGHYHLAARDPAWVKRKPEITLDLVLLGGVYSVTSKETAGLFGSYVIGARNAEGGFDDVGDVAGVDKARDLQIQSEIMRLGLLTGKRIERPSSSGVRPGLELRPAIVVTVKFEGVVRDRVTGKYSLRDPKIAVIRSDKSAHEADDTVGIQKVYLDMSLS